MGAMWRHAKAPCPLGHELLPSLPQAVFDDVPHFDPRRDLLKTAAAAPAASCEPMLCAWNGRIFSAPPAWGPPLRFQLAPRPLSGLAMVPAAGNAGHQ